MQTNKLVTIVFALAALLIAGASAVSFSCPVDTIASNVGSIVNGTGVDLTNTGNVAASTFNPLAFRFTLNSQNSAARFDVLPDGEFLLTAVSFYALAGIQQMWRGTVEVETTGHVEIWTDADGFPGVPFGVVGVFTAYSLDHYDGQVANAQIQVAAPSEDADDPIILSPGTTYWFVINANSTQGLLYPIFANLQAPGYSGSRGTAATVDGKSAILLMGWTGICTDCPVPATDSTMYFQLFGCQPQISSATSLSSDLLSILH